MLTYYLTYVKRKGISYHSDNDKTVIIIKNIVKINIFL